MQHMLLFEQMPANAQSPKAPAHRMRVAGLGRGAGMTHNPFRLIPKTQKEANASFSFELFSNALSYIFS